MFEIYVSGRGASRRISTRWRSAELSEPIRALPWPDRSGRICGHFSGVMPRVPAWVRPVNGQGGIDRYGFSIDTKFYRRPTARPDPRTATGGCHPRSRTSRVADGIRDEAGSRFRGEVFATRSTSRPAGCGSSMDTDPGLSRPGWAVYTGIAGRCDSGNVAVNVAQIRPAVIGLESRKPMLRFVMPFVRISASSDQGDAVEEARAGDLLFVTGQVAQDPATGEISRGPIREQTRCVMACRTRAYGHPAARRMAKILRGAPDAGRASSEARSRRSLPAIRGACDFRIGPPHSVDVHVRTASAAPAPAPVQSRYPPPPAAGASCHSTTRSPSRWR